MRRLIVLRPEPGATKTVREARQRGLDAVAIPLFEVEPVAWEVPDLNHFNALLLTSANAVLYGGAGLEVLKPLPVYAVGPATAEAAREAGFEIAVTGAAGLGTGGLGCAQAAAKAPTAITLSQVRITSASVPMSGGGCP